MSIWGELTIDLTCLVANWRSIQQRVGVDCDCAAVVKANAYGLGLVPVARALAAAGCQTFFVATVDEAKSLREALGQSPHIAIFSGLALDAAAEYFQHRFVPVLYTHDQVRAWASYCRCHEPRPSIFKIDTGMHRLGMIESEFGQLLLQPDLIADCHPIYLMSHLGCADEPQHWLNRRQLESFVSALERLREQVPQIRGSFANSSGVALGSEYHFGQVRVGASLYGINPQPDKPNPMSGVVGLKLPILQTKTIHGPAVVGYGATYYVESPKNVALAIVAGGYADGIFRYLGGSTDKLRAHGYIGRYPVPLVGRVSMDLSAFDVSSVPSDVLAGHGTIALLDERQGVDQLAAAAGTIGYEVLTALGGRYQRNYKN